MKTLSSKDNVSIVFGEWFHASMGNTYYDAEVFINNERYEVSYKYGYNAGDVQSIDEALAECGYRVRKNSRDWHKPYRAVHTSTVDKLKRELYKSTQKTG